MIEILIPGYKLLKLKYLVMDFNGVLAIDGKLIERVIGRINKIDKYLKTYILTADTYGTAREELQGLQAEVKIISGQQQAYTKKQFVKQLGSEEVVAIGNGNNDAQMLEEAALGIAVIQQEGAAVSSIMSADLVVTSVLDALDLIIYPDRIKASLRT